MAETVTMPKLGFDMAEGTLVRWVVSEGDEVKRGTILAEIETDKATVEVESNHEGTLRRQLVTEGDVVPVGTPIAIVGGADEQIEEQPSKEEVRAAAADAGPGGFTAKEIAGDTTSLQPNAGTIKDVPPAGEQQEEEGGQLPGGVRASPLARRVAEERGVNLQSVQGTGPQGRITRKDVEDYLEKGQPAEKPGAPAAPAPEKRAAEPQAAYAPAGAAPESERVPVNRLRAAIGRRMVESKQQVPHFYVTHEYDVASLIALRKQVNGMLSDEEKISINDFIIKAVALTLRQFPNLNASLNGNEIVRHGQVNIGVAVAVEGGLLTVVCRDADRKPLSVISSEVRIMANRAREGKVRPDDIEGSTFSISNLGMFDVESFVAIINPPEAAILAVGSAREVPVVENGEIKAGMRMKATISIDHRVSDGAEGARFMQALAGLIESPMRMLI